MNSAMPVGERARLLVSEAERLGIAAGKATIIYFIAVTAISVLTDQFAGEAETALLLGAAQLGFGYYLTTEALYETRGVRSLSGGFGTYFGLSMLSSIGIALGALVFLIPGVILFVRWAPLNGFGLVDGEGIGSAFGKSWDVTGQHFWPIFATLAPAVFLSLGGAVLLAFAVNADNTVPVWASMVGNSLISLGAIAIILLCVSVYSLLVGEDRSVSEVFD